MSSPTARTLAYLRGEGMHAAVVERWNNYAKIRQDLWGVFDVLAFWKSQPEVDALFEPGALHGVLAVQTTSGSNLSKRLAKLLASPIVKDWLIMGNHCHIHGWSKKGPRGKRKTWQLTELRLKLQDFAERHGV